MASTIQYEVVAVMKSGEVQRAHSTDWQRIQSAYNDVRFDACLYKVLWKMVDHSPLDPTVVKSWTYRP